MMQKNIREDPWILRALRVVAPIEHEAISRNLLLNTNTVPYFSPFWKLKNT